MPWKYQHGGTQVHLEGHILEWATLMRQWHREDVPSYPGAWATMDFGTYRIGFLGHMYRVFVSEMSKVGPPGYYANVLHHAEKLYNKWTDAAFNRRDQENSGRTSLDLEDYLANAIGGERCYRSGLGKRGT